MLTLNTYDEQTLSDLRTRVRECAEAMGGLNRLFGLVETILAEKPSPLQNKTASFHYDHGKVSWNKVLFADKVETLAKIIRSHDTMENLLETASKKEQNAIRTLFPVTITVTPKEGAPYSFKAVEAPDEKTARINPLFELIFFSSTGMIKKAVKEA
jgi:archaellin